MQYDFAAWVQTADHTDENTIEYAGDVSITVEGETYSFVFQTVNNPHGGEQFAFDDLQNAEEKLFDLLCIYGDESGDNEYHWSTRDFGR